LQVLEFFLLLRVDGARFCLALGFGRFQFRLQLGGLRVQFLGTPLDAFEVFLSLGSKLSRDAAPLAGSLGLLFGQSLPLFAQRASQLVRFTALPGEMLDCGGVFLFA